VCSSDTDCDDRGFKKFDAKLLENKPYKFKLKCEKDITHDIESQEVTVRVGKNPSYQEN
jgi:hypothetical protein